MNQLRKRTEHDTHKNETLYREKNDKLTISKRKRGKNTHLKKKNLKLNEVRRKQ